MKNNGIYEIKKLAGLIKAEECFHINNDYQFDGCIVKIQGYLHIDTSTCSGDHLTPPTTTVDSIHFECDSAIVYLDNGEINHIDIDELIQYIN